MCVLARCAIFKPTLRSYQCHQTVELPLVQKSSFYSRRILVQSPEANVKAALVDKESIDSGTVRLFEVSGKFPLVFRCKCAFVVIVLLCSSDITTLNLQSICTSPHTVHAAS